MQRSSRCLPVEKSSLDLTVSLKFCFCLLKFERIMPSNHVHFSKKNLLILMKKTVWPISQFNFSNSPNQQYYWLALGEEIKL